MMIKTDTRGWKKLLAARRWMTYVLEWMVTGRHRPGFFHRVAKAFSLIRKVGLRTKMSNTFIVCKCVDL